LDSGASRASVLLAFSESAEHVTLTAPLWSGGVRFQGYASAAPAPAFVASVPDPGVQFQIDGVPEIAVHVRHEGQVLEVFSHDDFIALP
ncbi:DUF4214 domain-containing protein, partial [Escherichia coli]|nr:DUF4214 domain-containing protein [Escherichia coli]